MEKTNTWRVQAIFEAAFREYGLPQAIRTDNGAPFATRALAGLSRLAVWWIKLGIVPERIQAGHPEQNGRHERMHRTLKAEATQPPASNRRQQQQAPSIGWDVRRPTHEVLLDPGGKRHRRWEPEPTREL